MEITENTKTLKFDANGLIPAIVQDHYTKEVLTLAYMNAETLALTIAEGRTVFWSRSRQEIWRKGETSGNVQRVVSITADCDKDALVVDVIKNGPACHTGPRAASSTRCMYRTNSSSSPGRGCMNSSRAARPTRKRAATPPICLIRVLKRS